MLNVKADKQSVLLYLLEKIESNEKNVIKKTSESFGISTSSVQNYLKCLQQEGILIKQGKGKYCLQENIENYCLNLKGYTDEMIIYSHNFQKYFKHCTLEAQKIWEYVVAEMLNNILEHSKAENIKITVKQTYLRTEIILQDDGVGIFAKIKEYFNLYSLDDARCELLKGKLTTDNTKHSGEGIFFTSRMLDEFYIVSDSLIYCKDKYCEDCLQFSLSDIRGTCFVMRLSNYTQRKVVDVFDDFTSLDYNFVKTHLKIVSMFETAPVSRSQAKRLCNRLSIFEEIVLDFDGVDYMQQGFAHQVFVVFQNEHPEVKVVAINMNSTVEMMFKHVVNTDKYNKQVIKD